MSAVVFLLVLSHADKHLPNVFGGPATLNQCDVNPSSGHTPPGIFGQCWTGSLFGFSGLDGQTNVQSQFIGWFINGAPQLVGVWGWKWWQTAHLDNERVPVAGSYSVYWWMHTPRLLNLGFGADADPANDTVLVATNDNLLVERHDSSGNLIGRLGVTWRDWSTVVGFIEGSAEVALQDLCHAAPTDCCGAVKQVKRVILRST